MRRAALVILITLLAIAGLEARDLWLSPLDNEGALVGKQVNVVEHSHDGYVWIGTLSGLLRYDGFAFKHYYISGSPAANHAENDVDRIVEDAAGRLWLKSHSLWYVYTPQTDRIELRTDSILSMMGVEGKPLFIHNDSSRSLWIFTDNNQLWHLPADSDTASVVDPGGFEDFRDKKITDVTESREGPVFVTNHGELYCVDPRANCVKWREGRLKDELERPMTFSLLFDHSGRGWVYNAERMYLYDIRNRKWITDLLPNNGRGYVTKSIMEDNRGQVWIGRDHHGLERVETGSNGSIIFVPARVGDALPSGSTVSSLTTDIDGTIWIGTYKHGVHIAGEKVNAIRFIAAPDVNCFATTTDGKAYVGTDADGVLLLDPATEQLTTLRNPAEMTGPPAVTALHTTSSGSLYIGQFMYGLTRYTPGKGFERLTTGSDLDKSYIWSFAGSRADAVWVGTLQSGLFLYHPTAGVKNWRVADSALPSDGIMALATSPVDSTLYIATTHGMAAKHTDSDSLYRLPGTFVGSISAVTVDSRGLVWIASQHGLDVYDPNNNGKVTPIAYTSTSGMPNPGGLLVDRQDNVWVSDGARVFRVTVEYDRYTGDIRAHSHVYDKRDGILLGNINQRSFGLTAGDDVLVGGLNGICILTPEAFTADHTAPRVLFSSLLIENDDVAVGEEIAGRVVLREALASKGRIELSSPENDGFTLLLGSDSYPHTDKTIFSYRMEGLDTKWHTTPEGKNQITYTNLPPGHYRLLVKAVNSDGVESSEPAVLEIVVHPPFYLTLWAKILYGVLMAGIVLAIVRAIRRRDKRIYREQQLRETRRKEEELNAMKFRFFTNIGHDLRTPLTLIISPLESMLRETRDESNRKRLSLMRKNAGHLLDMVNQLLDLRKSDVSTLSLHLSNNDLVAFTANVTRTFDALAASHKIALKFETTLRGLPMQFDEDKIYKTLMNLIGNAFKFTPDGGTVTVTLSENEGRAIIKVADTGCGISEDDKARIFEQFFQGGAVREGANVPGYGIGLSLVHEYITLHKGSISVSDNTPSGAVFTVSLPVIPPEPKAEITDTVDTTHTAESTHEGKSGDLPVALVVDDNQDMLDFLKDGLSAAFHVVTALNGEKALEMLDTLRPDIILTDLMMPGMDGNELCRRIKSDPELAGIPIVVLSAKGDEQTKVDTLTIGAEDYLTKPFNIELLVLRMQRIVALAGKVPHRKLIDPEPGNIDITPLDEKMVEKAIKFVVNGMKRSDLSVEELAAHLGMSRVHLYKKLKAVTGKTPIEFIRLIRLKRAAQMLRESQMNVSEVAFQVGFNNPKYFARYFKEEYGMLPSAYQAAKENITFKPLPGNI